MTVSGAGGHPRRSEGSGPVIEVRHLTTTMRMIVGLDAPVAGLIVLCADTAATLILAALVLTRRDA